MNPSRKTTVAMQQLKQLLDQAGLSDWHTVLLGWLPNYDGWLAVMEAFDEDDQVIDDFPAQEIIELLQSYAEPLVDDIHFATAISRLSFLDRHARLTCSGKRWSAFDEPFIQFARTEPGNIPHVYQYSLTGESIAKYWLLGRLFELRAPYSTNRSAPAHREQSVLHC